MAMTTVCFVDALASNAAAEKCEINENGLRLAFFDGLKGKPSSFDPLVAVR